MFEKSCHRGSREKNIIKNGGKINNILDVNIKGPYEKKMF